MAKVDTCTILQENVISDNGKPKFQNLVNSAFFDPNRFGPLSKLYLSSRGDSGLVTSSEVNH